MLVFAQSLSSHIPKFICSFHVPKFNSFILPVISISFILQIIVHLIHIRHIWFYSYCIAFQPHCFFHFLTNPVSGKQECFQIKSFSEIYTVSFEAELPWYYYFLLLHKNHSNNNNDNVNNNNDNWLSQCFLQLFHIPKEDLVAKY